MCVCRISFSFRFFSLQREKDRSSAMSAVQRMSNKFDVETCVTFSIQWQESLDSLDAERVPMINFNLK